MKSSKLTVGMATFSVLLLAVIAWQANLLREQRDALRAAHDQNATPTGISSSSSSRMASLPDTESIRPSDSQLETRAPVQSVTAPKQPHFDWQQVESTDYRTYIQNLRAIGCPDQTVRDIVLADVTQAFAAKRAAVMTERFQDSPYWKSDADEVIARAKLERERREVDDSMNTMLRDLLGPDTVAPSTTTAWQQAALELQLSALPSGTREATVSLLQQYANVDAQIKELAWNHLTLENPEERLRIIEDYSRKREALHALLTPDQYELVDMTVSWTADNLRRAMTQFQPTEEEFRVIFREWRAQDENLAVIFANGRPDPGNSHVFDNIAKYLSPERYALFRETWWK